MEPSGYQCCRRQVRNRGGKMGGKFVTENMTETRKRKKVGNVDQGLRARENWYFPETSVKTMIMRIGKYEFSRNSWEVAYASNYLYDIPNFKLNFSIQSCQWTKIRRKRGTKMLILSTHYHLTFNAHSKPRVMHKSITWSVLKSTNDQGNNTFLSAR